MDELKKKAIAAVDAAEAELKELSDIIHSHPETRFEERQACTKLCEFLRERGFAVETPVAGLETAFTAVHGNGQGPHIAFLAEYDALPELGHACGHNLIAAGSVGAALALKSLMPPLAGTVSVIGTPGEEGGGGKVIMAREGVFEGVDVALITHPSGTTMLRRTSLAVDRIILEFRGKPAHAAGSPHKGVNALDAFTLMTTGISFMRQQMREDARVHWSLDDSSRVVNIIPEFARVTISARAADGEYLREVVEKVRRCAEGAALMTGAELDFNVRTGYQAIKRNAALEDMMEANYALLGIEMEPPPEHGGLGSTDMGDVSQLIPSLHPSLGFPTTDPVGHTHEFAEASGGREGVGLFLNAARSMAMTAVDLMNDPAALERAREAFRNG